MLQSTFSRVTAVLTAAMLTTFTFTTPSSANSAEVAEASLRVNIAGRQRMLSQRMSKAACFAHIGIDEEAHGAMLNDSLALFRLSHKALVDGDADIGLGAENIPKAIESLAVVDTRWGKFFEQVWVVTSAKQKDGDQIATLDTVGLSLLHDMNDAVHTIASGYGDLLDDMPMINSITIDVAGRQRMLTQKAAKEFCLIEAGIDVEANRAKLAETITLFSNTLEALINGMPGVVIAPPSDEILTKLRAIKTEWAAPYAVFSQISNGLQPCCDEQSREIGVQVELVLILMNQAVKMYETTHGNSLRSF